MLDTVRYDVLSLCETWCVKPPDDFIRAALSMGHRVFYVPATRIADYGWLSGGSVTLAKWILCPARLQQVVLPCLLEVFMLSVADRTLAFVYRHPSTRSRDRLAAPA